MGDRSITELRKCRIIVAGLAASYKIKSGMLENNPTGLEKPEIEHAVGDQ